MAKPTFLFDFDGTIADSVATIVQLLNQFSPTHKKNPLSADQQAQLRHQSSEDILRSLGISKWRLPFMIARLKREFANHITTIQPVPDIKDVLQTLHDSGHKLGIVSSNSAPTVATFLHLHEMTFFDTVVGKTVFSKSKLIVQAIEELGVPLESVYYVGDETRDIEAARKAHVKTIAVTWGINSPEILQTYEPNYLIHHPRELTQIAKKDK